ncbi:MAG: alpha/beta hydrolase [Candidatus Marinimicrobia bacterium]|nr:alpha/beta hydrolase [Candidatus Neomarinimicrobiota bacterium]
MKSLLGILFTGLVLLVIVISCGESWVNQATFYPRKGSEVDIDRLPPSIKHFFIPTEDGEQLSSFYVRGDSSNKTILYFHGNAGNASGRLSAAVALSRFHSNVLLIDYRGYGLSSGSPSENGIYTDGRAALNYLVNDLQVEPSTIFLYGRSLGSAVAVEVANDLPLAGLILVTPISSGKQVAEHAGYGSLASLIGTPFNNLEKLAGVNLPTLIIHGDRDEVLPLEMGQALQDVAPAGTRLIVVPGAGHNNIDMINRTKYYRDIDEFCTEVLLGREVDDKTGTFELDENHTPI